MCVRTLQETLFVENTMWSYQTHLEYHCAPARSFQDVSGTFGAAGIKYPSQNLTCGWDSNWTPTTTILPCACKKKIVYELD
jgi:hypothetical protein